MAALHPAILPFATGLLLFATLLDGAGTVVRRHSLADASYWNLLGGTLAALLAVVTGWVALGALEPPPGAGPASLLNLHRALGILAVAAYAPLAAWRLALKGARPARGQTLYLTLLFVGAALLLATTALGELAVYQHGVGVAAAALPRH